MRQAILTGLLLTLVGCSGSGGGSSDATKQSWPANIKVILNTEEATTKVQDVMSCADGKVSIISVSNGAMHTLACGGSSVDFQLFKASDGKLTLGTISVTISSSKAEDWYTMTEWTGRSGCKGLDNQYSLSQAFVGKDKSLGYVPGGFNGPSGRLNTPVVGKNAQGEDVRFAMFYLGKPHCGTLGVSLTYADGA